MKRIYFITCRAAGMAKIGLSENPAARLMKMQRSCPLPLALEASFAQAPGIKSQSRECAERRLHEKHDSARSHAEWFRLTPELEADIQAVKAGVFDALALPVATILTWNSKPVRQAGSAAA